MFPFLFRVQSPLLIVQSAPFQAELDFHYARSFGRRLRAAEVSFEDRQDLLGHKSERITTHYSQSEYGNLIRAANKVCDLKNNLVILNRKEKPLAPAKVPQGSLKGTNLRT